MDASYKTLIIKILTAIDYAEDKEAFANQYISLVQMNTINNLISTLQPQDQEQIKNDLTENKENAEKVTEILKKRFTDEQFGKEFEKVSQEFVTEWLNSIDPTLTDAQRQKLIDLSAEIAQQSTARAS